MPPARLGYDLAPSRKEPRIDGSAKKSGAIAGLRSWWHKDRMSSPEGSTSIVQLKVRLLGISPMIWRRVLAPASVTLRELHGILQVSMGWEGVHLYYFDIHAVHYGSFESSTESPDIPFSRFRFRKRRRFAYLYDMGDYWEHEVRVEQFLDRDPKKTYPVCTGGSGACPPEDCGGPPGYLEGQEQAMGYEARSGSGPGRRLGLRCPGGAQCWEADGRRPGGHGGRS